MKLDVRRQNEALPGEPVRPARSQRRRRLFVLALAVLVVLLASAGGFLLFRPRVQPLALPKVPSNLSATELGLANWQDYQRPLPSNALSDPALPPTPAVDKSVALLEDAAGQALIRQGQLAKGLTYLRAAALSEPDNLRYSNDYRLALRNHGRFSEEEMFFSQQAQHSKSVNTQIGLALSYVDEMRSCPHPPDGLVCQAQNSSRSISVLTDILAKHPYNIIARYARGLNHLYWPSLMGHLPKAQVDLQYTVALLGSHNQISNSFSPQAYAALGDVSAKDGQFDKAHNVWLNGKRVNPDSTLLSSRLNIPQDQLVDQENNQLRGLGVYVETDLAIFWQRGR
jgi:hypothetical protein